MDDADFDRLLQAHLFGTATPQERQRLVAAALESPARALEFAQVEEIREDLDEPAFRRTLAESLPDLERPSPVRWWQSWLRPVYLAPLAAGAVAAIVLIVVSDQGPRQALPQMAEGPRSNLPSSGSGSPLNPDPGVPPVVDGGVGSPGTETPAATTDTPSEELSPAFSPAASRTTDLGLAVSGSAYKRGDTVAASVILPAEGRLYAVVRGPLGAVREVYPSDVAADEERRAGPHTFSFPASARLDPEQGGVSTLRVFMLPSPQIPPAQQNRWSWLADHATFDEVTYETHAP